MKKLLYAFSVVALLFVTACDSDDDGFYNTKYVQAEDLMFIENPSATYSVGDIITIGAFVNRLMNEPGQAEPLDVVETTHAVTFEFFYSLEKKNTNGEWEVLDATTNYIDNGAGYSNVGYYLQSFLEFDNVGDRYEYSGGIQLNAPGQYRLNFSNNTDYYNKVFFRSTSTNNNIILNILSTSDNIDSSGMFNFTVN